MGWEGQSGVVLGTPFRLTKQLVWLFSAATERDPEMTNCGGGRGDPSDSSARTPGRERAAAS